MGGFGPFLLLGLFVLTSVPFRTTTVLLNCSMRRLSLFCVLAKHRDGVIDDCIFLSEAKTGS